MLGRDAIHAMNSKLGALNNQSGHPFYLAIFAQPGVGPPDFEYQFLNERIGDHDTPAQHKTHMVFMVSRERFAHQGLIPIEGFIPVDKLGQNYYYLENITVLKESEMCVGEVYNSESAKFWLSTLAGIEQNSMPEPTQLNGASSTINGSWLTWGFLSVGLALIVVLLMVSGAKMCRHYNDGLLGDLREQGGEIKNKKKVPNYSAVNENLSTYYNDQ
jgi:hypothetical protein